jgi:hypothetical protein
LTNSFFASFAYSTALIVSTASAADISTVSTGTPLDLIVVRGEILPGDADRFVAIVDSVSVGAVLLESPGGNLFDGLVIGRAIRESGLTTGVAPDTACASACALAWLGGTTRYMDPSALVGFHAAYVVENGLGSGLIDHIQKMTMAAIAMADMKVWAQRS